MAWSLPPCSFHLPSPHLMSWLSPTCVSLDMVALCGLIMSPLMFVKTEPSPVCRSSLRWLYCCRQYTYYRLTSLITALPVLFFSAHINLNVRPTLWTRPGHIILPLSPEFSRSVVGFPLVLTISVEKWWSFPSKTAGSARVAGVNLHSGIFVGLHLCLM